MEKKKVIRILLIEDEEYDVRRIKNTIKLFEDQLSIEDVVASGQGALSLLNDKNKRYDVVIMDFQIAGSINGENLIKAIKQIDSTIQIIVVTKMTINITDFHFASRLLEAGAMWYCTKYPGDIENYIYQPTDFILSIFNAYEKRVIERAKIKSERRLRENIEEQITAKPMIGESYAIQELRRAIAKYAESDGHVLITGHSGTGKELVAWHIHYKSNRRYEKFIPINCGSLPGELIESELFGFEKGAFTGATSQKPGLFELANNGTVFLDEIAELPKQAQVKLLRVIQDGELDKIGRTGKVRVNVRVIAATNKDLIKEVQEKRFREDLFYRLNVFTIEVPSLNQRRSDIPLLVNYFIDLFSRDMSKEPPVLSPDIMNMLVGHDWQGNIRQLQNIIQRLLMTDARNLTENDVKKALGIPTQTVEETPTSIDMLWKNEPVRSWREMENVLKAAYFAYVRKNAKSDAEAARTLGLAPPNYHRMCKDLGLK